MNSLRDSAIEKIVSRKNHSCYGMGLGIMILDDVYPGLPGDVRNASAWPYPIQYEILENIDIKALCYANNIELASYLDTIIKAAKKLENIGCRAVAAECGFFSFFQEKVAATLSIPTFMSSLLQVPWAQQLIGPEKKVAIITSDAELTDEHLTAVGISLDSNFEVVDLDKRIENQEFNKLWEGSYGRPRNPSLRYTVAEKQIVEAITAYVDETPEVGSLVLECTGYPPFARAIQRSVDLPIYSWGTLLDYAWSVVVHRDYYGHV
ncbi:MAG: hydantoin racemase [Woeseia sp.]|nr:hydantoin racemase [Woeseia sp.]|tara:strand:- start:335 stop:1126 length:792 start_codon:yes stop_codon:yes gene_type:complete